MKRTMVASIAASLVLVGCGPADDDEVAVDPTPSSTPTPGATEPTENPTVGTYPDFAPDDYTYTLAVSCFCPDAGEPVRVTVVAGEAVEAVYLEDGRAVTKGDQAPDYRRLTIDEVIEAANDTEADLVKVRWPEGQDYPTSVYVDQDELMVDEEIGYAVSDVVVG
ncbi:MAG: DUF6174 domain-containing protein [Nocardioides sp.]|nr:DUF6174 domain-containing protein [Nocardioides sp.]